jgi:carboxyl-terminal processing protease
MKYARFFTLLLVALAAVACSRAEQTVTQEPAPAGREHTDSAVVQSDSGSDGEVAGKAAREAALKELDASIEQLRKADNLHDAFRIAEAIENLGRGIAPELQEKVKSLPELPRVAGWRAVWTLGTLRNKGWDKGVQGLLAIVVGEGPVDVRVAAAEVLGSVASERHKDILAKALHEQVFAPEVKVQLAVALWRTSKDTAATKVLREMLGSDNDSFKIQAALALGEIYQLTADAKEVLEVIADEPTLRGRTARRALDYERALKRLDAAMQGRLPGQKPVEPVDTRLLDAVEQMLKERYIYPDAISGRKLLYAAASGMLDGLDPYTCLLEDGQLRNAGEIRRFAAPTLGIMLGSARMQENRELRLTRILSVRPGSPADRAGLRPGDRVYRVLRGVSQDRVRALRLDSDDLPEEATSFQLLQLDEAIGQFHGALGTSVGLNIMRDGWLLSRWVHLVHEEPDINPVSHEMLPGGIGMIHINELSATSPARTKEAMAELRKAEAKAIILDLRNCAGGSVEAATQVAAMYLPSDTLVTWSTGRSAELAPKKEYRTTGGEPDTETPLTVLINGGTADAGEVLAGALREHGRAKTSGERTFGRAIVQELIPLTGLELEEDKRQAALLLTVARYYAPVSELPYYDRGVEPDKELTPKLFEGWIYDQFDVLRGGKALADYLDALQGGLEADALRKLARGDARRTEVYPGFDEFYAKVEDTRLEREDVRYLLRAELRKRLLAGGADIYQVDLQEDTVFTGAVKEAARAAGIDLSEIPEYSMISK